MLLLKALAEKINLNEVPITLSEAISLGSSPDSDADLSDLIRGNNSYLIDYEYYARTSTEIHEIYVKSDDVIHIPFNDEKRVYVVGEVVKQSEITLRRERYFFIRCNSSCWRLVQSNS